MYVSVPQNHVAIAEKFGKFKAEFQPGFHWTAAPGLHLKDVSNWGTVANKEGRFIEMSKQTIWTEAIDTRTKENALVKTTAMIQFQIMDPQKAVYSVDNMPLQLKARCLHVLRTEVSKLDFDQVFNKRDEISVAIVNAIAEEVLTWGVQLDRVDIGNFMPDPRITAAEDEKRVAKAEKESKIVRADAVHLEEMKKIETRKEQERALAEVNEMKAQYDSRIREVSATTNAKEQEIHAAADAAVVRKEADARAYAINTIKSAEEARIGMLVDQLGPQGATHLLVTEKGFQTAEQMAHDPAAKMYIPHDVQLRLHSN